jgi:hypothetical protein
MRITDLLKSLGKAATAAATAATLHTYVKEKYNATNLQDKFNNLKEQNEALVKSIQDSKINDLQREILTNKVTSCSGSLKERVESALNSANEIIKVNPGDTGAETIIKHHSDNIQDNLNKFNELASEIIDAVDKYNSDNNYIPGSDGISNFFNNISNLIDNFYAMLSTLTTDQLGALAHLLCGILIL